jgi:starch phosphorylase
MVAGATPDTVTGEGDAKHWRRSVQIGAWRYLFAGVTGHTVPLIFLDADLPENDASDRSLTDYLYGGDERYRLCQEVIWGSAACSCCGLSDSKTFTYFT